MSRLKTLTSTRRAGSSADFGKVAVLLGGDSSEREISLLSGNAVLAALKRRGVNAEGFDPGERAIQELVSGGFDRAWIALHGPGGEDGIGHVHADPPVKYADLFEQLRRHGRAGIEVRVEPMAERVDHVDQQQFVLGGNDGHGWPAAHAALT